MTKLNINLSVIIPVYNSEATIPAVVSSVIEYLDDKVSFFEIILINDGSSEDDSRQVCEDLAKKHSNIIFISLSKNFGEHNAVMAGLQYSTGEIAVIIDDDLQNPPSEIIKLIEEVNKGYDVVYSKYEHKQHGYFRNFGSKINDIAATILLKKPRSLYLSSFKAINRFLINEIIKYTGPYPYIDGLIWQVTDNYSSVLVKHNKREMGESGYTLKKLVSLWLRMFTNFSVLPLRLSIVFGLVISLIGFFAALLFLIEKFNNPDIPLGWASLIISFLLLSGIQLCSLGMIGEYLGRLFLRDNGKPQYVIRDVIKNKH